MTDYEPLLLEAERQRLRALGHTEAKITDILVRRALESGAGASAAPAQPQGTFSNPLSSVVAVTGYVGGLFASIPADMATILDPMASARARRTAFATVSVKAIVIGVLAFGGWQEWQQHVISAPKTAASAVDLTAAQATKAKEDAKVAAEVAAGQAAQAKKAEEDAKVAEQVARGQAADARRKQAEAKYAEELAEGERARACSERMKNITETLSIRDMGPAMEQYNRDCNPRYKGCETEFQDLLAVMRKGELNVIGPKLTTYKDRCPYGVKERDQALMAMGMPAAPAAPTPTPSPSYSVVATPTPEPRS